MVANAKDKKTLRLGNWQVFMLGKFHELYLKGDQCNVTFRFEDGQSILAHKIILASCSTYFEKLPSVHNMVLLKMPTTMAYQHVKPIIDFMYTGKLEYMLSEQMEIFAVAKNLSITVLTELLLTQNQEMLMKKKPNQSKSGFFKQFIHKHTPSVKSNNTAVTLPRNNKAVTPPRNNKAVTPPRNNMANAVPSNSELDVPPDPLAPPGTTVVTMPGKKLPFWKKRSATITLPDEFYHSTNMKAPVQVKEEFPKPTRFEWPDEDPPKLDITCNSVLETAFENLSYECEMTVSPTTYPKPVICNDAVTRMPDETVIRRGLKRASEVVRGGLSDDEDDYDDGHFESIHDTEEEREVGSTPLFNTYPLNTPPKPILKTLSTPSPSKKVRFSFSSENNNLVNNSNEQRTPSVTTPSDQLSPSPAASSTPHPIVNANSTPINTSKIVSEILKKYPDLVKSNKNIKLKIQTGAVASGSKPVLTSENIDQGLKKVQFVVLKSDLNTVKKEKSEFVMGAENRTGPWFCNGCGNEEGPMNFETYYLYRRHLQDVHNERIDARICEHCGYKASKRNLHLYHLYTKHNIPPPRNINFPKCDQCEYIALSESLLIKHRNNHAGSSSEFVCRICNAAFKSNGALMGHMQTNLHQQDQTAKKDYKCPFCYKIFNRNINLKAHIRTSHHLETIRKMYEDEDRINDSQDIETMQVEQRDQGECSTATDQNNGQAHVNQNMVEVVPIYDSVSANNKTIYIPQLQQGVTILSEQPSISLMPSSESEALNNVATGIATSIKITDQSIPNEVIVIDDQSELILQGGPAYIQNQDGTFSSIQEYIVPEIMGDSNNRGFTSALVSSAPSTGITYVSSDIPIVTMTPSDHTYADGLKVNGQINESPQVSLVPTGGPSTVISSPIQVSQASQPIIMNTEWLQSIATSQSQGVNLGPSHVEIISGPIIPLKNGQQKVEIISASSSRPANPGPAQVEITPIPSNRPDDPGPAQVEITSVPSSRPADPGPAQVEIISPPDTRLANSTLAHTENGNSAETLVNDWGEMDDEENGEVEQQKPVNEDEMEVKPSRPTIDLEPSSDNENDNM